MVVNAKNKKLLAEVLFIPTAPFCEQKVSAYIIRFCLKNRLKLRQDPHGNLFLKYKKGNAHQPVTFVAHMDHPGFHVLDVDGTKATVVLLGNVNTKQFAKSKVVVISEGEKIKGRVLKMFPEKCIMGKPIFLIETKGEVRKGDFGYYDLPGAVFRGKKIFSKSIDNLVSVAALLDLARELKSKKVAADVTLLFTRAEEVGFIGCISAINSGAVSKRAPVIVLEASSASAGKVAINGGPVVRVGDKQSGFTPEVDAWLQDVCSSLSKKERSFKFQRALLPGGRCETSAFMLKGYMAGCIALPLGNYHNNGPKKYEMESIGEDDYANLRVLLFALIRSKGSKFSFKAKEKELWGNHKKWARFLS